jgi:protease-4
VAKGRVWTGADAQPRKLVDALGGYATALDLAKQAAGIPAESEVTVKLYPPARDPASALIARAMGRGDDEEDNPQASSITRTLALLQPLVAELELLTAPPGSLVMTAPDLR